MVVVSDGVTGLFNRRVVSPSRRCVVERMSARKIQRYPSAPYTHPLRRLLLYLRRLPSSLLNIFTQEYIGVYPGALHQKPYLPNPNVSHDVLFGGTVDVGSAATVGQFLVGW